MPSIGNRWSQRKATFIKISQINFALLFLLKQFGEFFLFLFTLLIIRFATNDSAHTSPAHLRLTSKICISWPMLKPWTLKRIQCARCRIAKRLLYSSVRSNKPTTSKVAGRSPAVGFIFLCVLCVEGLKANFCNDIFATVALSF